jgi:nitroreductase
MSSATLDWIFGRRSIRQYTDKEIDQETINLLLQAAMSAPSAAAKDPWRFIVLQDKKVKKQVAEGLTNGTFLKDAPLGFVVCGDISAAHRNELSYLLQDCSAAIENILLAVHVLGLGACWLGVHPRQDRIDHIKRLFDLSDNIIPVSCIAIGYPAEKKEKRTRFNRKYLHIDKW